MQVAVVNFLFTSLLFFSCRNTGAEGEEGDEPGDERDDDRGELESHDAAPASEGDEASITADGSGGDDEEAEEAITPRDEDDERLPIRKQTRYYARTPISISRLNFPVGIA
jgi:hypothetical protein